MLVFELISDLVLYMPLNEVIGGREIVGKSNHLRVTSSSTKTRALSMDK